MFPRRAAAVAVALAISAAAAAAIAWLLLVPGPREGTWPRTVYIPKGASTGDVVRILRGAGLVRHPRFFRLFVVGTLTAGRLQHGEYRFKEPPSAYEAWQMILKGEVARWGVTIPEGSNLYDVARILGEGGITDERAFIRAATSPAVAARLCVPGKTLEGFLFPDTYNLVRYMEPEAVAAIMVRRFRERFTPDLEERGNRDGFSLAETVTIASIIEKETGKPEEKPLVSAVIRKRLALGMPLQMDPTVIYGLMRFGGDLTRKDLAAPGPYNSYVNRGLPPGPITNPGIDALKAAVDPAVADYLYFVSRNDGSHVFSRTLEEHNRAVAAFQKRRPPPGTPVSKAPTPPPRPRGPS